MENTIISIYINGNIYEKIEYYPKNKENNKQILFVYKQDKIIKTIEKFSNGKQLHNIYDINNNKIKTREYWWNGQINLIKKLK
jgi:hypothetical protein